MPKIFLPLLILLCGLLCTVQLHAQSGKEKKILADTSITAKGDTSLNTFIDRVEYYTNAFNQMNAVLIKGFDTTAISQDLPNIDLTVKYIQKGTKVEDRSNTLRFLYSLRDILTRLEDKLNLYQKTLSGYNDKLVTIQNGLIQVKQDQFLKIAPTDSILNAEYQEQMKGLNQKWARIDALNKQDMRRIGVLQSLVVANYIQVTNYKERINLELRNFGMRAFSKEYPYLWQSSGKDYTKSFSDAWETTLKTSIQLLNYYFLTNWGIHIFGLLIFISFYSWTLLSVRKIRLLKSGPDSILNQAHYIPEKPLLSALLISLFITFFLYDHPPVVFMEIIMLVLIIATGLLVRKTWPKQLFRFWIIVLCLTLVAGLSNLFLLVSYTDRIIVFLLGIAGAGAGWQFLQILKNSKNSYPEKSVLFVKVFVAVLLFSVFCNIIGRFSLAKMFLVAAVLGIWQAMSLVIFVRVLMEAVFLQLEASKENSGMPTYFDFALLQQRFKSVLNIIAILLWLILLAGNLNILDALYDFAANLLTQTRKIGGNEFTYGSIVVFVLVIWAATVVSKAVSYFFEFADYHSTSASKKNKLSSSILLIKLAIFSIGFLLAITASGIPMEKITIILGALSVGIGFGLQTIVNNLVSGIILAVEKPVEVGDVIEIGTKSGTVKEMGIRASKIATADGSEIIVPNGDLLSQHLTNWTLSNNHRRVELIIGVAYGSDLKVVKDLFHQIIDNREDIMQDPKPMVLIHYLNSSSVDFRILFWVEDISNWITLKSQVLSDVYEVFYREGISLPFPQSDVYIHYPDQPTVQLPNEDKKD